MKNPHQQKRSSSSRKESAYFLHFCCVIDPVCSKIGPVSRRWLPYTSSKQPSYLAWGMSLVSYKFILACCASIVVYNALCSKIAALQTREINYIIEKGNCCFVSLWCCSCPSAAARSSKDALQSLADLDDNERHRDSEFSMPKRSTSVMYVNLAG